MNLLETDAIAYHGVEYAIPIVAAGSSKLDQVLSVEVAGSEHGAQLCTVASSNPLRAREFASVVAYESAPYFQDQERLDAKLCVSWARGQARFYAECDVGCALQVFATSISVAVATIYNRSANAYNPRKTNVAITRGGRPHSASSWSGPVWSSGPVTAVAGSGARIAIPPYACAYRLGSHLRGVCQVTEISRNDPLSELPADGYQRRTAPIYVANYSEVHPLGTDANYLVVFTPRTWSAGADDVVVAKFLLDL